MTALVELIVESPEWEGLADAQDLAERAAGAALAAAGLEAKGRGIAILLTDDARIAALNARHRGKDAPTDVLSWPAFSLAPGAPPPPGAAHLGDIALAHGVVARDARASGVPFADHFRHLVAHGALHLLGYDHICERDAGHMEELERRALASLGVADPYRRNR